jgi:uncharacterized protein (DUF2141 family)
MFTHYLLKSLVFVVTSSLLGVNTRQTLVVSNLENKKGQLFIGWYNSAESYNKRGNPVFKKTVTVSKQTEISIPFDEVPDGKYAISIFLDENGNGKMDTNFLGIPKEKYGFSNNVIPATRAARFDEAAFDIQGQTKSIPIRLK